ncbi:MAG: hypothetical protein SVU69_02190 [Pseudomonadota bacterium]|nr:hypothetical protein [Pseudomonadota bacterium]
MNPPRPQASFYPLQPLVSIKLLQAKLFYLSQPQSYPEPTAQVKVIETHMSWVFLTDDHAYKLKKPVATEWVDFTTVSGRKANAERELQLNRRLAPNVYLGLIPLTQDTIGHFRLDGEGEIVDWLVKMRRLPGPRMLDYAIRHGTVTAQDIDQLGHHLARFYHAAQPLEMAANAYRERLSKSVVHNLRLLNRHDFGLHPAYFRGIHHRLLDQLDAYPALFAGRASERRIVEGHGDLRPEHVCLTTPPAIFDCLEFKRDLRVLDAVDELAYLDLECERLGEHRIGPRLLTIYREKTGDRPPNRLIRFYKAYRACIRARLAAFHLLDVSAQEHKKWRDRTSVYLELANRYA